MAASSFFARLLTAPKPAVAPPAPDNLADFDAAWCAIKETLEHPNERQLLRGIASSDVPRNLKHIVDALVYEGNRTDEDTTGACLEHFLRHDMLAQLERLSERDRPRGVKAEVLRAVNNLVVLLSERFLVHNAVHRPLRRLLRSCVGDAPVEKVDGEKRVFGAASLEDSSSSTYSALEEDLVDLMCILCSRMRAYPPLLLIFFHDRGWLVPHNSSGALDPGRSRGGGPIARALSPTPSMHTGMSAVSGVSGQSGSDPATTTHFEFLLFSYLLRFVHREGRTGDFARAGLLFLFDIAFLTGEEGDGLTSAPAADGSDPMQDARDALAEYILDGDFADVMAAGLGAAFSVLPSKIRVPNLAEQAREDPNFNASGGMHIGAGEKIDEDDELMELPSSTDMDVRAQLDLLLKLFGFLQDILYRCRSPVLHADPAARTVSTTQVLGPAVHDAALDAIQTAFVDNVLYPSVLECSSNDGSAVAILTYLDVLLSNLENGPVLHRIMDVLSDADGTVPAFSPVKKGRRKQRKTGAMGFVPSMTSHHAEYYHSEGRFTLRDLILDNLRSGAAPAATASLHLLATLLSDHCKHITPSLFTIIRDPAATALAHRPLPPAGADAATWQSFLPTPSNAADVHVQEPELYGGLVPRLDDAVTGSVDTASGFASYLADAHALLETDGCWVSSRVPLQFVSDDGKPALLRVGEYETDPLQHALSPSDPIVRELITSLTRWFTSSPDTNVALTGTISALARCPHRSLAGFILYDPPEVDDWTQSPNGADGAYDSDSSFDASRPTSRPEPPQRPLPALYQILRELVRHVGRFRAAVDGFDRLLAERRQGLLFADHLEEAMSAMLEPDTLTPPHSPALAAPSARKASLASSIKNLWSPRRKRTVSTAGAGASPASPMSTPPPPAITPASPLPSHPATPLRASTSSPLPIPVPGRLGTPAATHGVEGTSPPFKSHYVQAADAGSLEVEPVLDVQAGRWGVKRQEVVESIDDNERRGGDDDDDDDNDDDDNDNDKHNDTGNGNGHGNGTAADIPSRTSLSAVLDNCIVLEELIKELVALITARRALGIDQVGFV